MFGFHLPRRSPPASGFTLSELIATIGIITLVAFVVGAVLFPIVAKARSRRNHSCVGNLKQLTRGFLQYAQDNDEKLPPAAPNFASKYLKNSQSFCPDEPQNVASSYMMNDLASGAPLGIIANQSRTVLVCDGEDFSENVGHYYNPNAPPAPALFTPNGGVYLGATVKTAPTRHNGGANYGFADGHVKWFMPEAVFFPPRFSSQTSHRYPEFGEQLGPAPADKTMKFRGHTYYATFHLN